jgi:hypothetical protein
LPNPESSFRVVNGEAIHDTNHLLALSHKLQDHHQGLLFITALHILVDGIICLAIHGHDRSRFVVLPPPISP